VGELIRRVDGRRPAQFFREEIAQTLPADFQMGLSSKAELSRMATPRLPVQQPGDPASLAARVYGSVQMGPPDWEFLSADIPSGSGVGNGRSIAQVCAIFAMGGAVGGVRYLSERLVSEIGTEQVFAEDPLMGPMRFGLGLALDSNYFPAPSQTSIHWGGYGGSWGFADPRAGVSLGYTPNNLIVETEDGYPMEPRLRRFSAALKYLLPTL
jgi:CubicO group peptidase (beta-lactamase class C family)